MHAIKKKLCEQIEISIEYKNEPIHFWQLFGHNIKKQNRKFYETNIFANE